MSKRKSKPVAAPVATEEPERRPLEDQRADAQLPYKLARGVMQPPTPTQIKQAKPNGSHREIYVRPMDNTDMQRAMQWWSNNRERSHFDERVIQYKSTAFMCAYEQVAGPLLYMPVQTTWILDALGPNPLAKHTDLAEAFNQLIKVLHFKAREISLGEIYFPCDDKDVAKLALAHGFEEVGYPCYKLRIL